MGCETADSNVPPPVKISSARIWSLPGDLYFFYIKITISNSRWLGPGTNCSALCTSICQKSLILRTFNNWQK
jgi:hypothetical protein